MNKEMQRILKNWKSEAKADKVIHFTFKHGELTIYTNQPGYLIGKGGWLINKYTKILKNGIRNLENVRIIETNWYTVY